MGRVFSAICGLITGLLSLIACNSSPWFLTKLYVRYGIRVEYFFMAEFVCSVLLFIGSLQRSPACMTPWLVLNLIPLIICFPVALLASPYFIWLHVLSSQSKLTKDNGAVYGQSYGMGHLLARATGLGNNVTDQQYTPPSFPASASAPVLHPQHPQYNQDVQPDMQPPPYNPAFQQQTSGDLYPMIVK